MTYLRYTGKTAEEVGVVPLQEGWPAASHQDDDKDRVKEKLASGFYEKATASEAKEEAGGEPIPSVPVEAPAEEK